MPYTLSMALLWVALAVLLGIVIGWLMRSVVAKRQIERARSNHLDNVELERLRARVSELEPVVVERDRFRDEVDAFRSTAADVAPAAVHDVAVVPTPDDGGGHDDEAPSPAEPQDSIVLDLSAAAVVLGKKIEPDDLTVIDGIGPKIADLCDGIGIQTWRDLAQTEVSLLRTMLHDAGPRFRSHDPSTWPEQAALLAEGRWADFRALADGPDGGSAVD
jgi:predicted flap endonuclease-1-like 5' DNA nuclease